MSGAGTFPFGNPILEVAQADRGTKRIFVLGVYASAVHARWIGPGGKTRINAVAVASEPEIFWRGEGVNEIAARVGLPERAGRLKPASGRLNGPSGRALDDRFLSPLGLTRKGAWLCDLVPHSCMNERQEKALEKHYAPERKRLGLPAFNWPRVPVQLADEQRRFEISEEFYVSKAEVLITLGDQPLRWFARHFGSKGRLSAYGRSIEEYGRFHRIMVDGREARLLPLVHPRQAAMLGSHSSSWAGVHEQWRQEVAPWLLWRDAEWSGGR